MSRLKHKNLFSIVLIFIVAAATGVSLGKIYLDSNVAPTMAVAGTEAEYRSDEAEVAALVAKSQGRSVMDFSALELYQIAEYNLEHAEYFLKEGLGTATSTGVSCDLRIQKVKYGDDYGYYKMSPSKKVMGVATPAICVKMLYNAKTDVTVATRYKNPTFLDTSLQTMEADFGAEVNASAGDRQYTFSTSEEYQARFRTVPTRAMAFILSDKTTTSDNFGAIVDNGDGTYTFSVSLNATNYSINAALYYAREIQFSCGYSVPYWSNVKLEVTIDDSFNFVKVHYVESYKEYDARSVKNDEYITDSIPMLSSASVVNDYVDTFYFGKEEVEARVLSNFLSEVQ